MPRHHHDATFRRRKGNVSPQGYPSLEGTRPCLFRVPNMTPVPVTSSHLSRDPTFRSWMCLRHPSNRLLPLCNQFLPKDNLRPVSSLTFPPSLPQFLFPFLFFRRCPLVGQTPFSLIRLSGFSECDSNHKITSPSRPPTGGSGLGFCVRHFPTSLLLE